MKTFQVAAKMSREVAEACEKINWAGVEEVCNLHCTIASMHNAHCTLCIVHACNLSTNLPHISFR